MPAVKLALSIEISLSKRTCSSSVTLLDRESVLSKKYESFSDEQKLLLDEYLHDYCPELEKTDNGYKVNNEVEMTKLLNGINQRYYTTPVDKERRLANSVSVL